MKDIFKPLSRPAVVYLTDGLLSALLPDIYQGTDSGALVDALYTATASSLLVSASDTDPEGIVTPFIESLPAIRELALTDAAAILDSDPAATALGEVLLCYPGFYALVLHRLAHRLYTLGAPVLARLISEHAHRQTGIDVHPGASLGRGISIDHGTGIVIGETAELGNGVSIYHGVTLGAREGRGRAECGKKRHPTVGDSVTLYCGATVLGGDTTVGTGSVIGAGVVLTSSVPPYTLVTRQERPICRPRVK